VSRCALFGRLAEAERVVQMSAPAGSGKTVLMRSWIAEAGLLAGNRSAPPPGSQAGWARSRGLDKQLTHSEIRVLRYLPTQLTGPEIADELFLSVNTVGTHTRHLYAKLGVHSRREAVDRARGLGLLAPSARKA
jgi:LuxR family maltose regulon positive regulatory protein